VHSYLNDIDIRFTKLTANSRGATLSRTPTICHHFIISTLPINCLLPARDSYRGLSWISWRRNLLYINGFSQIDCIFV